MEDEDGTDDDENEGGTNNDNNEMEHAGIEDESAPNDEDYVEGQDRVYCYLFFAL